MLLLQHIDLLLQVGVDRRQVRVLLLRRRQQALQVVDRLAQRQQLRGGGLLALLLVRLQSPIKPSSQHVHALSLCLHGGALRHGGLVFVLQVAELVAEHQVVVARGAQLAVLLVQLLLQLGQDVQTRLQFRTTT